MQALFNALVLFCFLPNGFTNREFRERLAPLLGLPLTALTAGRVSYQLRRLRLHGLIERQPHTNRYRVTPAGLRTALFCTRSYSRLLRPGFINLQPQGTDPKLARLAHDLEVAIGQRATGRSSRSGLKT